MHLGTLTRLVDADVGCSALDTVSVGLLVCVRGLGVGSTNISVGSLLCMGGLEVGNIDVSIGLLLRVRGLEVGSADEELAVKLIPNTPRLFVGLIREMT